VTEMQERAEYPSSPVWWSCCGWWRKIPPCEVDASFNIC